MAKIGITVGPNADEAASIARRTPLPTPLRTSELAQLPLAIRESAQFSATVENVRYLQYIQDQLSLKTQGLRRGPDQEGAYVSRERFIAELQQIAREEGIATGDGTLRDPGSFARAKLIYDIQTQRAAEYARWLRDQDPVRLQFYPCQELVRIESRMAPRDWQTRWLAAGGNLYTGRMIAAKNAPIWTAISRFETPWPPFDFNSGMGLRDISRHEAEGLGILGKNEVVPPVEKDFNDGLEASIKTLNPEYRTLLEDLLGDLAEIIGDTIRWIGGRS